MKNILITGTYSVGKSTTTNKLEDKIHPSKRIVTYDQARYYLDRKGISISDLTQEQRKEMQLMIIGGYIGALHQAKHARMMAILDGSLIEASVYGRDVIHGHAKKYVDEQLHEYHNHSIAYVIPPTIPLENDGIRHTDKDYRVQVHEDIMKVIQEHHIPYHLVTEQSEEARMYEILYNHTKHNFQ